MITSLIQHTIINYDNLTSTANLLHRELLPDSNHIAIFVDQTSFHPVDNRWNDQPADKGTITCNGIDYSVIDCYLAAFEVGNDKLFFDKDIPVKRNVDGWIFLVAHIIDDPQQLFTNDYKMRLDMKVDPYSRNALSAAHSACHLAALAFNKITKDYWKGTVDKLDSLGNPNLDSLTIFASKIQPFQSFDSYRFGKSIRKKGLNSATLLTDIQTIEDQINIQLKSWLSDISDITVAPLPSIITAQRNWHCQLPDGEAIVPCGGTHIKRFTETQEISVQFSLLSENEIIMNTKISKRTPC